MTLMSANEYIGRPHTILMLDTAGLVRQYEGSIELAHMNTGNTRPFAHKRGPSTFKKMEQYPYEDRRRRSAHSAIVELTIPGGVPDVREYVIKVEHATAVDGDYKVIKMLYERQ
jgi:hypothetical protein